MRCRRNQLAEIAGAQEGFFTASQARRVGYSYPLQHLHHHAGNWEKVGHGVYRLPHFPLPARSDLIALSLWSRRRSGEVQAVASHETALSIYELSDVLPVKNHLTVPPGFRKPRPPSCVLHRERLEAGEWTEHAVYRVTTPLRTLCDVAEDALGEDLFHQAVAEAIERGLVRRKGLAAALPSLSERGCGRLQRALASAGFPGLAALP